MLTLFNNLKPLRSGILAAFLSFAFLNSALAFSSSPNCKNELRKLILPPLKHVFMNTPIIRAEIVDSNDDVYSARLYIPADGPGNMNKQVSIGWVNLDIKSMKAYDVTNDLNNRKELDVNRDRYEQYVATCILATKKLSATVAVCNAVRSIAEKSATVILGSDSQREVIGENRLLFYSAPDQRCVMPGVYILSTEKVDARSEYKGYTFVEYSNLKTKSKADGWVNSNRLRPTGLGIAPRQK